MNQRMQTKRSHRTLLAVSGTLVAASVLVIAGMAVAEAPRHSPPRDAFTACDSKASGDVGLP